VSNKHKVRFFAGLIQAKIEKIRCEYKLCFSGAAYGTLGVTDVVVTGTGTSDQLSCIHLFTQKKLSLIT